MRHRGVRQWELFSAWCGLALLSLVSCDSRAEAAVQPMAFSHAVHAEQDTTCVDCHIGSEEGQYATIPTLNTCLLCHEEPQGEDVNEPLVREYAERDEPIPWVQVNRVVGHVYFSHAPHVVRGELDCKVCHGEMTTIDEPVTESQIDWMTMDACMDCHTKEKVSNDCLLCHK